MSLTMLPSQLTAKTIYKAGTTQSREEHREAATTKVGTLRGGNSGCITDTAEVYGTCHRKSLARYLGLEVEPDSTSQVYFDAGFANEAIWEIRAKQALGHSDYSHLKVLVEEECPVAWANADGVPVTGRPDMMLWNDDTPVLGFEFKSVSAVKSACSLLIEDAPKTDNLIQAAHYSMEHGCPFSLIYSYRSRAFTGWLGPWLAKKHGKLDLLVEHPSRFGKAPEYSIEPFDKEFLLGWEDGHLYYMRESGERVDTPITEDGIRRYYNAITEMQTNKDLFVRTTKLKLDGTQYPWDPCGNCEFKPACDQFEHSYDDWVDKVTLICEGKE
jgi:hypothetical protein